MGTGVMPTAASMSGTARPVLVLLLLRILLLLVLLLLSVLLLLGILLLLLGL